MRRIGFLFLLALTGCGGGLLAPSGPPPKLYTLAAPNDAAMSGAQVNWQLLVDAPNAPLDLDSDRIAIAPSPNRIDYYADVAWVDRLPAMVQALMVESFDRSGRIAAVQRAGGGLRSDFTLASELRDFEVGETGGGAAAHVRLGVKLVRMRDRSIVASKDFDATLPVGSDNFDAVIAAFNGALADLLPQIVSWTLTEGAPETLIRALCTLAVLMLSAAAAQAETPPPVVIGTGPVAGFAFALGGEICRLYEQESGADKARCSVVASDGSVEDLKRLRTGEIDLALVQSDHAGDALTANGAFVGMPPFAEIRGILGFYTDALTVLVRADGPLKTVDDLKGKRIAVGEAGDPDTLFGDFLEALGWLKTDMGGFAEMARGDQISALCRGRIAAIAVTAPHPNGFVRDALAACPTRLLDLGGQGVDAAVAAHHAYGPVTIDAGTYGGPKQPIQSFGPRTVLVTTAKLPDEIVARLAAAIFGHLEALKKAHPAFGGLDSASLAATAGLGVARHPAAIKYLSDNKLAEPPAE